MRDQKVVAREAVASLFDSDEVLRTLGIHVVSVSPGTVVLAITPERGLANSHGIIHGGIVFTLADTAFAYALASRGRPGVTTSATISYLAPARVGSELTATSTETYFDGIAGIYDVDIRADDGSLVAAFRGQGRVPKGQAG